ncbi:TRAP transporter substrate-binding protein [Devosia sp. BK]|uniref:TRAP transporter substrate-binding protein n=1 Tax=Devosia sp. BK TaxID=2871706 RepID=UPI00293A9F69|nr:TRAP transporter substrate-binding protein [Devosia sp. BK]MDV3253768.1 TRAP transporter substrate-binding protein [Devosia sp. BK]
MTEFKLNRRQFALMSGASVATSIFMPAIARAQAPKAIRLAHHLQLESEQHIAAEAFATKVNDYSDGALEVTVLPAGQMGGQREIVESISLGLLEMGYGESGIYSSYVSQFGILALPYMYKDFDQWQRVVDGPVGQDLAAKLQAAGNIKIVNTLMAGYRSTFLRTRPIKTPEDFDGVKIRLPEAPAFVKTFAALGASPTPIPAPEMYSALQTGVVDAMEGSLETGFTYKIYEVCKYLSLTRHILNDGSFIINNDFLNGLTVEEQDAISRAGADVALEQRASHFDRTATWLKRLGEEGGITINEPNLVPFQQKLAALQEEFAAEAGATELLAQIRAA